MREELKNKEEEEEEEEGDGKERTFENEGATGTHRGIKEKETTVTTVETKRSGVKEMKEEEEEEFETRLEKRVKHSLAPKEEESGLAEQLLLFPLLLSLSLFLSHFLSPFFLPSRNSSKRLSKAKQSLLLLQLLPASLACGIKEHQHQQQQQQQLIHTYSTVLWAHTNANCW